jgi:hypothetical protein
MTTLAGHSGQQRDNTDYPNASVLDCTSVGSPSETFHLRRDVTKITGTLSVHKFPIMLRFSCDIPEDTLLVMRNAYICRIYR